MLPLDRTTVIGGPCVIPFNGVNLYSESDVTCTPQIPTFAIGTSRFGKETDLRLKDAFFKISFTPTEATAAILNILFAMYGLSLGSSIFGANDVPLEIIGTEATNNCVTFRNAAVSKMPDFGLKSSAAPFGVVEFTALGGKGLAFTNANRIVAVSTVAYPADTFNADNVITGAYTGQWATTVPSGYIIATNDGNPDVITTSNAANGVATAHNLVVGDQVEIAGVQGDGAINGAVFVKTVPSPSTFTISATNGGAAIQGAGTYTSGGTYTRANLFDAFDTADGFNVSHQTETKALWSNNAGTYDILLSSLSVSVKSTPLGPGMADIVAALNLQGNGVQLGMSMATGRDLYAAGTGLYFRLKNAALVEAPSMWSADKRRAGAFTWKATRSFTGGAPNQLAEFSTNPLAQ